MAIKCVVQKYRDLFNTELSTAVQTASLVTIYQFMSSALRRAVPRLPENRVTEYSRAGSIMVCNAAINCLSL